MMIASSKKHMPIDLFFLPEKYSLTLEQLESGPFYPMDYSNTVLVPYGCVPVWCPNTGDFTKEGNSYTNLVTGQIHTKNPFGFRKGDCSFFDGFYETTQIEGLTFGEGEAWDLDTNKKVRVEKMVPTSLWNPFFQRYDPPCNRDEHECNPLRIKYNYVDESFHTYLFDTNQKDLFFEVYDTCCICDYCGSVHTGMCT